MYNQIVLKDSIYEQLFEHNKVRIYGSYEKPYFVCKDIGQILGIKYIKSTSRYYNENEIIRVCRLFILYQTVVILI